MFLQSAVFIGPFINQEEISGIQSLGKLIWENDNQGRVPGLFLYVKSPCRKYMVGTNVENMQ